MGARANRRVRRLSRREYNNVVRDLLGESTRPADAFLEESYTNGYDNGSAGLALQADQVTDITAAAEALAESAVKSRLPRLLEGCNPAKQGEAKCAEVFLARFPYHAFRRPLTADEKERYRGVFDDASAVGGFSVGVRTTIEAILQSPSFLYREELGPPEPGNAATVRLTDYEVASELSFLLTGSMPDAALFSAVEQGRLKTPQDAKREGSRLLSTPAARAHLRTFFHQWLATNRLQALTKDAKAYPTFTPKLRVEMGKELDLFFDHVLRRGEGTLRELFSSTTSYAGGSLAQLYGLPDQGAELTRVNLDSATRRGVLTRPGYLAVHSGQEHSSPIERGVFLRQALLCAPLPPPPPDVIDRFKSIPAKPGQTTREKFAAHSSDPACSGCHKLIDGVGFGFEEFDGIGAFRATENGAPVDSSGRLIGTDVDGAFTGVSALSARLLESPQFTSCFVKQAFRFVMGTAESPDDEPTLAAISSEFTVDSRMDELFLAFVGDPSFFERGVEKE